MANALHLSDPREVETHLIGAALGCGAQDQRTEWGPLALKERGLVSLLQSAGCPISKFSILQSSEPRQLLEALPIIADFNERLAVMTAATRKAGQFPIVLGGDHSIAIGTWSGIAQTVPDELGLLWIDAHMDSHTTETSETGAVHGMPLAALLGHGDSRLTEVLSIFPKLQPDNVCLLGIRSFESGEANLLAKLGVRVYFMEEIRARGFEVCLQEARQKIRKNSSVFGITLDLDGFDPGDFAAVGSPVSDGLRYSEVRQALKKLAPDPALVGFELVEYNPFLDQESQGFLQICALLQDLILVRQTSHSEAVRPLA